jgi:hypothetical protein
MKRRLKCVPYLFLMSREIPRVLEAQLAEPIYRCEGETYILLALMTS